MRSLLILCLIAVLPTPSFGQGKKTDDDGPLEVAKLDRKDAVLYEKEIEPIFKARCFACHHPSTEIKSKLNMSTYELLIKGGKRGSPIVPGKSQDSLLFKMAAHLQAPFMPPKEDKAGPPMTAM